MYEVMVVERVVGREGVGGEGRRERRSEWIDVGGEGAKPREMKGR